MDFFSLTRNIFTDKSTIGDLYLDGNFFCSTLELSCRRLNSQGEMAIPPGRYLVTLTESPKFKRIMPLLNNVPGREGIRLHWGNFPADSEGCILVGQHDPTMAADFISNSRKTFDQLFAELEKRQNIETWISITGGGSQNRAVA